MSTLRQTLRLFADRTASPAALSARLAAAAVQRRDELIADGRASTQFDRYVDGAAGAPEASVRPDGVILYHFQYIGSAVAFALERLRARSPYRSGAFRNSFVAAIDGRPVSAAAFQPTSVPSSAEVLIYNPLPYSRKVDVQFDGERALKFSVPPGLFDDVAKQVRQQFGATVRVQRLSSIRIPGQRKDAKGRLVDCPALSITRIQ